jgi:hypothetical protein
MVEDPKPSIDFPSVEDAVDKCLHILYNGKLKNAEIDLAMSLLFRNNLIIQLTPVITMSVTDSVLARIVAAGTNLHKEDGVNALKEKKAKDGLYR